MGDEEDMDVEVADVLMPGRVADEAVELIAEAMKNRPDLSAARLNQDGGATIRVSRKTPALSGHQPRWRAGVVPIHYKNISSHYSAGGLNMTIPFLNGGLNGARLAEAEFRARGAGKDAEAAAGPHCCRCSRRLVRGEQCVAPVGRDGAAGRSGR